VLQVPSIVVDGEFNYVLNPRHADFGQLKIGAPVSLFLGPARPRAAGKVLEARVGITGRVQLFDSAA